MSAFLQNPKNPETEIFVFCVITFDPITITVFPHTVSALEYFPPLNSFRTFMYCDLWSYVL